MENIRKVQVELLMMKTTIYKMKNILDQINSRLDTEKEKKISELEYSAIETIQNKIQRKKIILKNEKSTGHLRDNLKTPNISVNEVPKGGGE